MSTARALLALREAHSLLTAAVLSDPRPPGPLLHAAVEVADALEALEADAIEAAVLLLGHVWPRARVRVMLRRAVQEGDLTVAEIAAWTAAQSGGDGLEAESALDVLLDVVEAQEVALAESEAAMEDEQGRAEGGERG